MHPIERLRYVARSHGGDQRLLVHETAGALRGLGVDAAGLVVACRRILERHPTSGALWALCASVLSAPDPYSAAVAFANDVDDDPTPEVVVDALPADATVCVVGWPDLAGEALLRRGDARVLAVDVDGEAASFARRLHRAEVEAEVVPAAGLAAAALAADLVVVEAVAAGPDDALAARGSRALASVAYCSEVPVWLVVGRGRCLPEPMLALLMQRAAGSGRDRWSAGAEPLPVALASVLLRPAGAVAPEHSLSALAPECPLAGELLRPSPM